MTNRYRSMDCLRAIAILLVILAHSVLSYGAPPYLAPLQFGGTGVDLFFVLSGWLLGGLLFKEINNTKTIDIKRFWARRWMRTLPAYFAVLILLVLQRYITKEDVYFPWQYFIFVQNYYFPLDFFSISWSLCVEEQFYLFIALFLLLSSNLKKYQTTALLLVLLFLPFFFRKMGFFGDYKETHISFDGCVLGVLLAQFYNQYRSIWDKISKYFPLLALITLLIYISFYVFRYIPQWNIRDPDKLLLVLLFGSWVILSNYNQYWRAKIYFPGANYIATRSYSLYLLHPEMLAISKKLFMDTPFVIFFIITIIGSIILAEVLYRIVEHPMMNLREKLSFSKSKS